MLCLPPQCNDPWERVGDCGAAKGPPARCKPNKCCQGVRNLCGADRSLRGGGSLSEQAASTPRLLRLLERVLSLLSSADKAVALRAAITARRHKPSSASIHASQRGWTYPADAGKLAAAVVYNAAVRLKWMLVGLITEHIAAVCSQASHA